MIRGHDIMLSNMNRSNNKMSYISVLALSNQRIMQPYIFVLRAVT